MAINNNGKKAIKKTKLIKVDEYAVDFEILEMYVDHLFKGPEDDLLKWQTLSDILLKRLADGVMDRRNKEGEFYAFHEGDFKDAIHWFVFSRILVCPKCGKAINELEPWHVKCSDKKCGGEITESKVAENLSKSYRTWDDQRSRGMRRPIREVS